MDFNHNGHNFNTLTTGDDYSRANVIKYEGGYLAENVFISYCASIYFHLSLEKKNSGIPITDEFSRFKSF